MGWKQNVLVILGIVFVTASVAATAYAQSSSESYMVNEYFFGSGGELDACSTSYCSKQAAGEVTVGSTSSDFYMAQAGFNTTDVPLLEVAVNGSVDFGVLSAQSTATGTATVQVRTYLASGYDIIVAGDPPKYGAAHTLDRLESPDPASAGTEQFGINLVENTTLGIGSDPEQVPDDPSNPFSFGYAATNYNVDGAFMYEDGDVVAKSDSSSGQTNYTVSFIANMSGATPAGQYTTELSFVVISTF